MIVVLEAMCAMCIWAIAALADRAIAACARGVSGGSADRVGGWARVAAGSAAAGAPRGAAQRPAASRAHAEHEQPVACAVHVGAAPLAVEVVDPVVVDRITGASGPVTDPAGGEAPHQDHPAERGTNSEDGWRAMANGTSGAVDRDRPGRVTGSFFALGRKVLPAVVRLDGTSGAGGPFSRRIDRIAKNLRQDASEFLPSMLTGRSTPQ